MNCADVTLAGSAADIRQHLTQKFPLSRSGKRLQCDFGSGKMLFCHFPRSIGKAPGADSLADKGRISLGKRPLYKAQREGIRLFLRQ